LRAIRDGAVKRQIEQIRNRFELERQVFPNDISKAKEAVSALKRALAAVLWSGLFSERNNAALLQHSGILCADLDGLNGDLHETRARLLNSPYLRFLFLSPSGDGLKAGFRVLADNAKHHASFLAVEKHVLEVAGKKIDGQCKDVARMCFMSYDPELFDNPGAIEIAPLPEPKRPQLRVYDGEKPSKAQIREMLKFVPTNPGYEDWYRVPSMVGDALNDDDAIELLKEWSAEKKPGEYAEKLRHRLKDVHVGSLIHLAQKHGWKPKGAALSYAFVDLQTVTSQAVTWIEEPFLARGELHALMGLGGSYKGTLTLTWAAEFSRKGSTSFCFRPRILLIRRSNRYSKLPLPTCDSFTR